MSPDETLVRLPASQEHEETVVLEDAQFERRPRGRFGWIDLLIAVKDGSYALIS